MYKERREGDVLYFFNCFGCVESFLFVHTLPCSLRTLRLRRESPSLATLTSNPLTAILWAFVIVT